MKQRFRKIGAIVLLMVLTINLFPVNSSATVNKPSSTWNLSTKGTYSGGGDAKNTALYSNYNFTGASKMRVKVVNKGDSKITVNVYRTDDWVSYYRKTVDSKTTMYFDMNITSSKKYYLKFSAPCKFDCTVSKI